MTLFSAAAAKMNNFKRKVVGKFQVASPSTVGRIWSTKVDVVFFFLLRTELVFRTDKALTTFVCARKTNNNDERRA